MMFKLRLVPACACAIFAFVLLACGDRSGHDDTIDCSACAASSVCTPGASTACACPIGFDGDGTRAGTGCRPIDDCAAGAEGCGRPGVRADMAAGLAYVCAAGYQEGAGGCVDIDECAAGTDTCVRGIGTCTNTAGSFTCGCIVGYHGDGDSTGTGCSDVDECAAGTDVCVRGTGTCANSAGGYGCGCIVGYRGDGNSLSTGCTDVDECAAGTDGCVDVGGTCTNIGGGYVCGCAPGYQGDGTAAGTGCTEVDECANGTDTCRRGIGTCTNTAGGYACGCIVGYAGDGDTTGTGCSDVDECAAGTDFCIRGIGTCTNSAGGYGCGCILGYQGDGNPFSTGCTDVDECAAGTDVCVRGTGTCSNSAGGYGCGCRPGYQGDGNPFNTGCTAVDVCGAGTDTCVRGVGTCTNTAAGFACGCIVGYHGDGDTTGTGCTDVDECAAGTDICVRGIGVCTNSAGGYGCGCIPGYQGDGNPLSTGCTDVDECAAGTDICVRGTGFCTNSAGGYGCGCRPGYQGDGNPLSTGCTDVDECAAGTATCNLGQVCINNAGGYTCGGCGAGYQSIGGVCVDVDECAAATDTCDPGQVCINTLGGYTCGGCGAGYQLIGGICIDLDECVAGTDTCVGDDDGGRCTNTPGAYTCACDEDNLGNGIDSGAGGTGCTERATNPRLIVPRRMPSDRTLTLRADLLDGAGKIDSHGCYDTLGTVTFTRIADGADIPITNTVFDNHIAAPADSIRFYHGVGSVSFTLDAGAAVPAGDYRVTVTVNGLTAHRVIHVLANPSWRVMPANLAGADLVWGPHENIRISQHNTTIPAGSTLTINPGTIVMVDTTGGLEDGTLILVQGQLAAEGSPTRPIHVFSERGPAAMTHALTTSLSNPDAWRGIFFYNDGSSTLKWTVLTGAGNGVVVSHPRPPILNLAGTHNLTAEDDVLVDSTGMMFQSPGTGTYRVRRSLISRVGIGAEFLSSGHNLLIEDTWWTSIGRGPTSPIRYDGDGVHIDGAASTQVLRRCIIADIGDDGIDHSSSTFTVEDSIIHGVNDKAMSMTGGLATVRNTLIFATGSGIRGTARVFNSTIAVASTPIATAQVAQESIIWPGSVPSCGGAVNFSILGGAGDLGCGMGNQSVNPQFVDTGQCDYTPAPGSPALTAGPAGGRIGWLGFPSF